MKAPEQQAVLRAVQEWEDSKSGPHDWAEQERYLKALDQASSSAFCNEMRKRSEAEMIRYLEAIKAGCYSTGGGTLMYLVSGRKVDPGSQRSA